MSLETQSLPLQSIEGTPLNPEQARYLSGFFAGVATRGLRFSDSGATASAVGEASSAQALEDLVFEERVKRERHPLDAFPKLLDLARANTPPDKDDLFRFKWNGLFFLAPNKEAYMARLRIPGGQMQSFQLREIARVASELTTGYVQITTRANLQIRLIEPKDAPEVLRRIQGVGLHTRGAGADNIRNLTTNATAGVDPLELIDTLPLCHELAQIILNDRAFYDLPRKFNIAYDGGGRVSSVEDTNDIGAKAVLADGKVCFRIAVGGATGHKAFARDLGVLVPPEEINRVICALVRVFITHGNRADRKKARLKHLLESWTLERYLAEAERLLPAPLTRAPLQPGELAYPEAPHAHVGVHPQKQPGLFYVGVHVPVGEITPAQMLGIAELAELHGSGEIRLSVWQNLLLPNIPEASVETVCRSLQAMGLETTQSHLRSGFVACTGNAYCKFAQTNTKAHAAALAGALEKKLQLDSPINIHLTGCPHSCAQHYMGDIGLLGTKTKVAGESVEAYHVFVGGGFGPNQAVGRQVFTAVPFPELEGALEKMLRGYLRLREPGESFQAFTVRHDLDTLQAMFSQAD
jgi:ferredoxin-nitrite reductase